MARTYVKQQIRWQHMHNGIRNAQSAQKDTKKLNTAAITTASCDRIARV